jgi:FMN phosphatase YigB (HAD superfamily)
VNGGFDLSSALAKIPRGRPLVIVDADEVLLRFVDGFDRFLRRRGFYLDLTSYRLHGNVKSLADNVAALDVEVTALIEEFRQDLDSLEAVPGAREALANLSQMASVAVLSNISEAQAPARSRNLLSLGFDLPLIANEGPKGPAVKKLAAHARASSFFVDDLPQHLASAAEMVPEVFRIHLVGDARLIGLLPLPIHAHCHARDWGAAEKFIKARLDL